MKNASIACTIPKHKVGTIMVNKASLLLLTLVLSMYAAAQTATVTATVQDGAGQAYANGTVNVQFVQAINSNGPFTVSGSAIQLNGSTYTGPTNFNLDGTGSFSITMSRNDFIQPSKSQWQFIICSNADSPCTTLTTTIASSSVSLSSLINSVLPATSVNSMRIPRAYQDSEIALTPNWGQFYFNVLDGSFHVYNNGLWTQVPLTGSSPAFNVVNVTTGYQVNGVATSGRYLKGNGTNFVISNGSASGVGSCTNQVITSLGSDASPLCTTVTSSFVDSSIAKTGTDINTSNQVTATHLASPLPTAQGGTNVNSTATFPSSGTVATTDQAQSWGAVNQTNMQLVTPKIGGETITSSPRGYITAFCTATSLSCLAINVDKPITVTRLQCNSTGAVTAGCTVQPSCQTAGTASLSASINNAATTGDTGSITTNVAAGNLTIQMAAGTGCTTQPTNINIVVQYKMQ